MPDPLPTIIESELDAQRVVERISELAGCLEDTPEERELIELVDQIEAWETKRWRHACGTL